MAALDFPAAPTTGQTWGAPNGVIYRWTGTLWTAIGNVSPSPGGDFMAISTADIGLTGPGAVIVPNSVLVGNAGGWYSTVTGRFTPPAGRYFLQVQFSAWNGGGTGGTSTVQLRKNGVAIPTAFGSTTQSGNQGMAVATALVDANGTDYFDCFGLTGASQGLCRPTFSAFPISGIKGPPGDKTSPDGDFFAFGYNVPGIGTTPTTALNIPVLTGNAGGWFNSATGRWTPPAGRYHLYGGYSFYSSSSLILGSIYLRKNGVVITQFNASSGPSANHYGEATTQANVDANGTDWFDLQCYTHIGNSGNMIAFGAFPLSGIKGPPGDPGPSVISANDVLVYMPADVPINTGLNVPLISTGMIGLAGQKWEIEGVALIGSNQAAATTAGVNIHDGTAHIAGGGGVMGWATPGWGVTGICKGHKLLTGPTTFTLRGSGNASGCLAYANGQGGFGATYISARRLY